MMRKESLSRGINTGGARVRLHTPARGPTRTAPARTIRTTLRAHDVQVGDPYAGDRRGNPSAVLEPMEYRAGIRQGASARFDQCGKLVDSDPWSAGDSVRGLRVQWLAARMGPGKRSTSRKWRERMCCCGTSSLQTAHTMKMGGTSMTSRSVHTPIAGAAYARYARMARHSRDTVRITARIVNPLAHHLTVVGLVRNDAGAIVDTVSFAQR